MNPNGIWTLTMSTPAGNQKAQLTVTASGDQLTGTLSGPMGSAELKDGKCDGDTATWKCVLKQPMLATVEFSAKFTGDALMGEAKLGVFGKAPFSGARTG